MLNFNRQVWFGVIVVVSLLPLIGCLASTPGSGGGQKPIQVTVSPSPQPPVSLPVSATQSSRQQFTASLTGTSNQAVTWSLVLSPNSPATASGSGLGTIDANGLYTAPQTIPDCTAGILACELQVGVTATSVANTSYSGQAPVNVHVVVSISPTNITTIGQGANLQFAATVTGTSNQTVNWGATGTSSAGAGRFDGYNLGLYVAPNLPEKTPPAAVTITATSGFDQSQQVPFNMTVEPTDPLGTVNSETSTSCPSEVGGVSGGNCYHLSVSCGGVADIDAYLKVNAPPGPIGTVIFLIGSGANGLYDDQTTGFMFGSTTVSSILAAGYNTVQVSFGAPFVSSTPNGWLEGPGGVRRLACRYATVADWVYRNPKIINSAVTTAANSAPMCATANSAGASAVAYSVSEYGLSSEFVMIEPTSGPVTTRLDQGCVCFSNPNGPQGPCLGNTTSMCYSPFDADILNNAYTSTQTCTSANSLNANMFLSDSVYFVPTQSIPLPGVKVNVLFGGSDATAAVPQGETWRRALGSTVPTEACIQDAPHGIPDVLDGAQQIATDIIKLCK